MVVKAEDVEKREIFTFLENKIAKWWMPDDIIFVEELPHTATGKIRKVELKNKYENYLINLHTKSDESELPNLELF